MSSSLISQDLQDLHDLDPVRTVDEPGQVLVSVRDLKTYFIADEGTTRAVDGVTLDIRSGQTLCVVGETGCGKSVMARSILRLIAPPGQIVGGQITLRRQDQTLELTRLPANGRLLRSIRGGDIGMIFQEPMSSLSPVHPVGDQIAEAVRLHRRVSRAAARRITTELLGLVGVPKPATAAGAYPWQLSGGLRQRAMIAMALSGEPRLLIADEPTTALDVTTQAQILELIRDLQRRTGMAVMLITHDLGVVAEMADEVAVMYLGRVVERASVEEIFHAPRHPYTQALLKSVPSVEAPVRVRLPAITGSIPHPFHRPDGCSFHPRCPQAVTGVCDQTEPAHSVLANGHEVSCHLYGGNLAVDPDRLLPLQVSEVEPVLSTRRNGGVLVEVRGLRKFFPIRSGQLGRVRGQVRAVDDVSFSLKEGETLALVGESGSGKTTISRCLLRAIAPDAGEILFRSAPRLPTAACEQVDLAKLSVRQMRPLRPQLQMIFQDPYSSLNPRMTVGDLIGEPLQVNGLAGRTERTERVAELLNLVGLRPEYMRRFPHAFSGGQRQRIGIARALALNPRLVVADEPVSALDVSVRAQILNLLLELQQRLGLTYLLVSHDLTVVKHVSDRIAVMYVGQLVELGDRDAVLSDPRHPYTAALLAAVPQPDPRARRTFAPPRGEVASPANPPSGCYFHPRCPFAVEKCQVEKPVWEEIAPGRQVRCHRARELGQLSLTAASGAPYQ